MHAASAASEIPRSVVVRSGRKMIGTTTTNQNAATIAAAITGLIHVRCR
ncbi:hypothetical protein MNBD_ACTINO02-1188, partial [hydrothermal vent metagenome]